MIDWDGEILLLSENVQTPGPHVAYYYSWLNWSLDIICYMTILGIVVSSIAQ